MYRYNTKAIFLFGPTASGKTNISLNIAKKFPVEIISLDSAMVYKDMNIGSCKPNKRELKQAKHHLVDILLPSESFNLATLKKHLDISMSDILKRGNIPFFVGGSMMYVYVLLNGFHDFPSDKKIKSEIEKSYETSGIKEIQELLRRLDKKTFETLDNQNPRRLIRAIEIIQITGEKLSNLKKEQKQLFFKPKKVLKLSTILEKQTLTKKIEERLDKIIKSGFLKELETVLDKYNLNQEHQSMQCINYKQFLPYCLNGKSLEACFQDALKATKNLGKTQINWLKKIDKDTCIKAGESESIETFSATITKYLRSN